MTDPVKDIETPGISEEAQPNELEKVELDEATRRQYQNRVHLNFWDRLRMTWRGQNEIGKIVGTVLDVAETFAPKWVAKTRTLIQYKEKKPMLQKILSIKNFINLRDENGDFSWQELGASLLQIVLAGAIVYGAQELGIWNGLMELLNQ